MKKKYAMRIVTILLALILCVPMMLTTANAATAGDGQEPAVFVLAFVKGEEVIGTSAFYVEDTLGDGSTYLVSNVITAALVEDGYGCIVMGLNYTQEVTYVTTSGDFAFFKAQGLEDMVPFKTGGSLTSEAVMVYANLGQDGITGAMTRNIDISNWTSVNGAVYAPGTKIENTIFLGAPIVDSKSATVVGGFSVTNDLEQEIAFLDGVKFPSQAAIVQGNKTAQQPAATQPAATQPQQPAATQPQQQEPQEPEDAVDAGTVGFVVGVAGVIGWFATRNGKKKKSGKTAAQDVVKPIQEGTIMLDTYNQKPIQPMPIGMPTPSWQIRGLTGPLEGKVFTLDPHGIRTMRLGRDPSCDVAFSPNTPGISGMHCELVQERGEVALRDLQSSYGTYMGRSRVRLEPNVSYHLGEGDEFMLADGGQVFRLERWGNSVQNYTPAVRSAIDGTVYRADREGRMAFGRDPRNQVVFDANDSSVSSTHCVLYREGGKLYLVDKDSTNGTYFDEKQRLRPNTPYEVRKGMSFFLTTPKYTFVITED